VAKLTIWYSKKRKITYDKQLFKNIYILIFLGCCLSALNGKKYIFKQSTFNLPLLQS